MKKNYTQKIVLAMLVVVLVSLVSFVGVYKGKNLLKEYSLGNDFSSKKVAIYSVKEEVTENTTAEDQNNEESSEENSEENSEEKKEENVEEKKEEQNKEKDPKEVQKEYKKSKNIIEKRLAAMNSQEYDIRLDEATGSLIIEVPSDMDVGYLTEIVSKGNAKVINQSKNETIIDANGFKSASAKIDSTSYQQPVILLNIKFTNDAKKIFKNVSTKDVDSEGNETDATFAFTMDGETLYSDKAANFVETAKNGTLDLVLGQESDKEKLEENYQRALALVSIINSGEISTDYQIESVKFVASNINIKTIIIIVAIVALIMLAYAIYKFKAKGILPVLSLVGLCATVLLVLRYTNVKITLFTILGLAFIVISNYIIILKTLGNDKSFKQNFVEMFNILVPCFIIAVVFCCSPYLQLASMGMAIFWGVIVMIIYNAIITRILIDK